MSKRKFTIEEPSIISAPVIYWKPSPKSKREQNENWRHGQVSNYLKQIGFNPKTNNATTTAILNNEVIGEIKVDFTYYESNKNVYKYFEVYRNGKKSNITTLRALYP